jgi:hypothetical protein
MEKRLTSRGFGIIEFTDSYGHKCSIQESSNASAAHIWFGVDDAEPQIMASDAIRLGLDTNGQTTGWVPYPVPKEVLMTTRMHLTQEQVIELLPILQKFAETGEL